MAMFLRALTTVLVTIYAGITFALLFILIALIAGCSQANAETLELRSSNTVTLRGPVDAESVAQTQLALMRTAEKLRPSDPIYLVLDTPGGDVISGRLLIDTIDGLPNKVHTVTMFAASMGFHIAQSAPGTRYIIPSGTLMSHRARGGLSGEMPGSFNTRSAWILDVLNTMDITAARRMTMKADAYKEMIRDEYWTNGDRAVSEKAADKVVNIRCNKDLSGTTKGLMQTIFGGVQVTFSKCPLIAAPLSVVSTGDPSDRANVELAVRNLYSQKTKVSGVIKNVCFFKTCTYNDVLSKLK